MINLDTNILLRVVKTDPEAPKQSELAREIVQSTWDDGKPIFITSIVLVECCWVLESRYKEKKAKIAEFIQYLLSLDLTNIEHRSEVAAALVDFKEGRGDFSDYLIGQIGKSEGCKETVTFDKLLKKSSLFSFKKA